MQPPKVECSSEYQIFILDIETTGLSNNDKIIEISILNLQSNNEYSRLINPEIEIPSKITSLTGITQEMVNDKPIFSEVTNDLQNIAYNVPTYIISHNSKFDRRFIENEFRKCNKTLPQNWLFIDSIPIFKLLFPSKKSYALDKLYRELLNINYKETHRGMSDVKDLWELLNFGIKSVFETEPLDYLINILLRAYYPNILNEQLYGLLYLMFLIILEKMDFSPNIIQFENNKENKTVNNIEVIQSLSRTI